MRHTSRGRRGKETKSSRNKKVEMKDRKRRNYGFKSGERKINEEMNMVEEGTESKELSKEEIKRLDEEHDKEEIRIVYPGDVIVESLEVIPGYGTYRLGEKLISKLVGIVKQRGSVVSVVPLNGVYMPKVGDFVVGEIIDIGANYWVVDINSPYDAFLAPFEAKEYIERESDLTQYYDVGDLIFAKVSKVTKTKYVNVSLKDPQARKLGEGLVIHVSPPKVPRIIGKGGSMIKVIKDKTNTRILVGQNGRIWIGGELAHLAAEAILFVEENSVMRGLTNKVAEFLDKRVKEEMEE